jgi:hypothetical protein
MIVRRSMVLLTPHAPDAYCCSEPVGGQHLAGLDHQHSRPKVLRQVLNTEFVDTCLELSLGFDSLTGQRRHSSRSLFGNKTNTGGRADCTVTAFSAAGRLAGATISHSYLTRVLTDCNCELASLGKLTLSAGMV